MLWRSGIVFAVASYVLAGGPWLAAARQGARNADKPKTVPEYSISGIVVEATTGKPVKHALVVLSIYGNGAQQGEPPVRRVMTDEGGKFEIRGITVVGKAGVEASKPGYHSVREMQIIPGHTMSSYQEVMLEPGADVRVELKPEATIEGRVVGEGGEPIEGLPIHLTFDGALNGRRRLHESEWSTPWLASVGMNVWVVVI